MLIKLLLLIALYLSATWTVLAVGSDLVWQALIAAVVTIVIAWMNLKGQADARKDAMKAAEKVKEVKDTLSETKAATNEKLDGLAQVAHDTHTLVNSNMAVQLKLNATMARELANLKKSSGDVAWQEYEAAAALAEKLSVEHAIKQAEVDRE